MRIVRWLFILACLFLVPVQLQAGLILSNESPRWGERVHAKATLDFPGDSLHPGDRVYLELNYRPQGTYCFKFYDMSWDGEKFTADVVIPSGCEEVVLYVRTPEKQLKGYTRIYPLDEDGNPPPGSVILFSNSDTGDEWLETVAREFEKYPDIWWAYREVWRRRIYERHDLEVDELLSRLEYLEKQEKTAELLRTLAMGYWYAAEFETAYARLEELCRKFPGSPYALHAINDATAQVSQNNLTDMRASLNNLTVDTISRAPDNPALRFNYSAGGWLILPGYSIATMKKICDPWIEEEPDNPGPHYYLADCFANTGRFQEAESELNRAVTLAFKPRPWDLFSRLARGSCFRLRSEVRAKQGRLVEALADIELAREHSSMSIAGDLEKEASLWMKLGCPDKAVETSLAAYRLGSEDAEILLKGFHEIRTKKTEGFEEWLAAELGDKSEAAAEDQGLELSPEFEGTTMQGEKIDSKLLKDDLVILNFWYTACSPCIGEIPELNRLVEQYKSDKIRFLAFTSDDKEQIPGFLAKHPFKYEIIPGAWAVEKAFGVSSHPTHVVIQSGRILWEASGARAGNTERLEGTIRRFLDGNLK